MTKRFWFLLDAAGDGAQGGAGGGSADAGAAAGASGGAAGAGGEGKAAAAEPSILAQGGDAGAAAAAAAGGKPADPAADPKLKADPLAWLPERYRVKGEGDALNIEESAKKVAGAYVELEKRMKDTGLPPESADKYEFKPPQGMEALQLDGELTAKAKDGLHKLGLTQKQYQGVMEMYVGSLNDMVERGTEIGATKAREVLAKSWGAPDSPEFKAQVHLANKAFNTFADDADKAEIDKIGNHPVILKILAKVGRELREDNVRQGEILAQPGLEQLMKDPAYMDASNPRHAEVVSKVQRHFQAQADAEARKQAA